MPSLFANPVCAPYKTKRFWLLVALGFVPIFGATLYMHLVGFRPPLLVQIRGIIITFALWVATFWFSLRFGRIVELVVIVLMLGFAVIAWLYVL